VLQQNNQEGPENDVDKLRNPSELQLKIY